MVIFEDVLNGMTAKAAGHKHGISLQRVQQIYVDYCYKIRSATSAMLSYPKHRCHLVEEFRKQKAYWQQALQIVREDVSLLDK